MKALATNTKLLTVPETAAILGTSKPRTADMIRRGILPGVRLGRQVRIDPEALAAFIAGGGKALEGGWRREAR